MLREKDDASACMQFSHLCRGKYPQETSNSRKSERDVALAVICLVALLTDVWVLIADGGQTAKGTYILPISFGLLLVVILVFCYLHF